MGDTALLARRLKRAEVGRELNHGAKLLQTFKNGTTFLSSTFGKYELHMLHCVQKQKILVHCAKRNEVLNKSPFITG
jgi:hypothetical protein